MVLANPWHERIAFQATVCRVEKVGYDGVPHVCYIPGLGAKVFEAYHCHDPFVSHAPETELDIKCHGIPRGSLCESGILTGQQARNPMIFLDILYTLILHVLFVPVCEELWCYCKYLIFIYCISSKIKNYPYNPVCISLSLSLSIAFGLGPTGLYIYINNSMNIYIYT